MSEIESASAELIAAFRRDWRYQRVERLSKALLNDPELSTLISQLEALQAQCRKNEFNPPVKAEILKRISALKSRAQDDPLLVNLLGDYALLRDLALSIREAIEER